VDRRTRATGPALECTRTHALGWRKGKKDFWETKRWNGSGTPSKRFDDWRRADGYLTHEEPANSARQPEAE